MVRRKAQQQLYPVRHGRAVLPLLRPSGKREWLAVGNSAAFRLKCLFFNAYRQRDKHALSYDLWWGLALAMVQAARPQTTVFCHVQSYTVLVLLLARVVFLIRRLVYIAPLDNAADIIATVLEAVTKVVQTAGGSEDIVEFLGDALTYYLIVYVLIGLFIFTADEYEYWREIAAGIPGCKPNMRGFLLYFFIYWNAREIALAAERRAAEEAAQEQESQGLVDGESGAGGSDGSPSEQSAQAESEDYGPSMLLEGDGPSCSAPHRPARGAPRNALTPSGGDACGVAALLGPRPPRRFRRGAPLHSPGTFLAEGTPAGHCPGAGLREVDQRTYEIELGATAPARGGPVSPLVSSQDMRRARSYGRQPRHPGPPRQRVRPVSPAGPSAPPRVSTPQAPPPVLELVELAASSQAMCIAQTPQSPSGDGDV
eukprot:TRINITY_DN20657_c0_g1_i2.p2 TRINITY_DN20657_c0_g1~~TRINITY_DN20657_c0_g1_i2.p2  ORF type:complete len:426 (+),score=35.43 TRINITY_DN20657_c0_g1_i2:2668-3945(+)